jgi:hypothetical protein
LSRVQETASWWWAVAAFREILDRTVAQAGRGASEQMRAATKLIAGGGLV